MRRFQWQEYRAEEFRGLDPAAVIAVLPLAAIEQHGPHLPVGVDRLIMEGMLATACPLIPEGLDVRILPVQAIGKSNEHLYAPGTLTLTAEAALAAWLDIGLSVARAGVRKLVIVNSHGGNVELMGILARELRVRAGMLAVKCQWGAFGSPPGLYSADELAFGIHGGDMETSLMLHFHPGLVAMEHARAFHSVAADVPAAALLRPTGPVAWAWIASDLNPAGTVGDASAATVEKGRLTAAHQAAGFVRLLEEVRAFDLGRLAPG